MQEARSDYVLRLTAFGAVCAPAKVWSCLPRMSVSHTFHEAPVQVKPQVLALLSCEAVVMGSVTISEEELVELICSLMQAPLRFVSSQGYW